MSSSNTKPLWQTKTFWGGVISCLTGVGMICVGDVATGTQTILTGIMAVFVRDAIKKTK